MNPAGRDTSSEEKTPRLGSGDGHGHSKSGGNIVMHDHGRHSPASAHSPGVSGKLPGLHPDSSRSNRGFGTPSFTTTGLPGFNFEHLPFLFNSASSLIFPPFLHPTPGSLFQPVLPPNFLPPPLPSQITSLFPSPNAECEAPSGGWSAHSAGSRNTSSLGSSSSDGDMAAKLDGRTVRSSRCSPDLSLPPASLSSGVHKIWEGSVVDPVCISDADMPLSLVTRRETTSRGSSAAESGVCTGDSVARAASTETSRTPSLDGESSCHPVSENSGVQEQTVSTDQWPAGKVMLETLPMTDDSKCSTGDDVWSSNTPASRSSGIALPPRKRLTRNAEELSSSTADQAASITVAAGSPSSATNFRSCWKKFAAKSNVSGPSSHRAFGGKPQYDCRTYFQKLAEQARAAAASKAFVPGKGKGHCYRNANKANSRSSDQNTGSPRVTRSQSKPKKTQSPKSSPAEPPAPVRKSTRKKSINSRFEEYDRTIGKNKKSKGSSLDSGVAPADVGKETSQAGGDEVTPSADKNSQRKNRRRGKHLKGELSSTDADMSSSLCADTEDSISQSQLTSDVSQPASETDYKLSCTVSCSVPVVSHEATDLNAKTEDRDSVEPEPSSIITVLPPKFRHFKAKTFDSYQSQTNMDWPVTASSECNNSEGPVSVTADSAADSVVIVTQSETITTEVEESVAKPSLSTSVENSLAAETAVADELKTSQSHSVGGRKSLLYRSSAAVDSQPTAEAKLTVTSSKAKCSELIVSDTVSDVSADEKCDVSSERLSALEGSLEHSEAARDGVVPESASSETSEKVQDSSSDVHVEHHVETSLPDIVSCKSASVGVVDIDRKTSPSPTVSHTTTAYADVVTGDHDTSTVSVDTMTERLDVCDEVPADNLDKCDSYSQLELCEGSSDNSAMSGTESVHSQSTISFTTASVVDEPRLCTTPVGANCETRHLTCRTKPADVGGISVEDSVSRDSESLKRPLPDEEIDDETTTKRRCTSSVDALSTDALGQLVDNTPDTNSAVNLISSTGDHDSQTCNVPSSMSCVVSEGKPQPAALSAGVQISLKSERLKSKSSKTNRRVKPSRRQRTVNNVSVAELPVLESSNNSAAETLPSESDLEKHEPPLLDKLLGGDGKKPTSGTTAIVKYAVANSVDKMCVMNTDVSSAHIGNEQKTLRISLVAINESNMSGHRVKDAKTESTCNSDKLSSSSVTVAVYTSASEVNNVEPLKSAVSLADDELLSAASTGCVVSQDSLTLEHDRSSLLSQCKTLSVVLEKMHNSTNGTPDYAATPISRRRRRGLTHHRVARLPKPMVAADDVLLTADNTASAEPSARSLADDEYRFPDDALCDYLPSQPMSRPDRKPSSRKARSSLPAAISNQLAMSTAAVSDSSSLGAASSVESVATGKSAVKSEKPNAVQKVLSKSETRIRRRKHSLKEDDNTRSLSPFAENDGLPPPVVEASLDGHKLKLRIMKCVNRSVEASTTDGKLPVMPPMPAEVTDNDTKLKDDKMLTPDRELLPVVEASPEQVSRRRRQLKVEGVRSRFLTLHKPSGTVPSADHVKCRLVKVGRRHWMSVGGEDQDDDLLMAQQSDAETPTINSPVASAIDDMAQHPARDRLLLVTERKKHHTSTSKHSQSPKAKTNLTDTNSSSVSAKRTKKRVKTSASPAEVISPKPELVREVVVRPARDDPVPWLDCETEGLETQPYCVLGTSSSRTIAADIDEYRLRVSTPAELTSNIDLVISDALSDCGVEFVYGSVRTPRSMYFVPSELERLMETLVLDDLRRQPRMNSPPTTLVAPEARLLSSASTCIARTLSYSSSVSSQHSSRLDVLLSQPSLRLQNCSLPVDASDSSECDCTVVGFEYPTRGCYPDSVELPSLYDNQFVDDDYALPLACPSEPHLYSYVDVFL